VKTGKDTVAEEISDRLKNVEVYFPLHHDGADFLVVKGKKHVKIKVNENYYERGRTWPSGHVGHSSHRLEISEKDGNGRKVDFYVFLTFVPLKTTRNASPYGYRFLVVPSRDLKDRTAIKDHEKSGFNFCFHFQKKNVWDEKVKTTLNNSLTDYTKFLNAWQLLADALD